MEDTPRNLGELRRRQIFLAQLQKIYAFPRQSDALLEEPRATFLLVKTQQLSVGDGVAEHGSSVGFATVNVVVSS
jgi:hypothetical protein